jgi:hypothetical protein
MTRFVDVSCMIGPDERGKDSMETKERGSRLTSHFSRISGQFLRISRRVYNAGGAVSSARPLFVSLNPK